MTTMQFTSIFYKERDDITVGELVRVTSHDKFQIFKYPVSAAFRDALHTAIWRKSAFDGLYGRVAHIELQVFQGPSGKITYKPIFWLQLSDKNLEKHVQDHFQNLYDFLPCKLSQVSKCEEVQWDYTDEDGFDGRVDHVVPFDLMVE